MRDLLTGPLARGLARFRRCGPGRHSAKYLTARAAVPRPATGPGPVSPWSRPWNAPSATEVRAVFRDERTLALPAPQRERVWAAALAQLGADYGPPVEPLGGLGIPERAAA